MARNVFTQRDLNGEKELFHLIICGKDSEVKISFYPRNMRKTKVACRME
jgi:hypothetical protein